MSSRHLLTLVAVFAFSGGTASALSGSAPPESEVPFLAGAEVPSSRDVGYVSTKTFGRSGLNSRLKDIAAAISVLPLGSA